MYQLVNLAQKFSLFSEQWQPKVVAEMNDYQSRSCASPATLSGTATRKPMRR